MENTNENAKILEAIEEIENGIRTELSCGYDCDITEGDHPEQINIRGNHIALCKEGRAGIAKIIDSKPEIKDIKPHKGEKKADFLSRFMKETKAEYPDEKQRIAVAYSYWNRKDDSMPYLPTKENTVMLTGTPINDMSKEFSEDDYYLIENKMVSISFVKADLNDYETYNKYKDIKF